MIYFDHNATTPLLPQARQAWLEAVDEFPGNPSSPHRLGARAETALHGAREKIAAAIGGDALDIIWTASATESNNMALYHVAASASPDAEVLISSMEHPCVLGAAERYFPKRCRLIPARPDGVVDLDWLEERLGRTRPALVAVMAVNNETGVLQPWPEIAAWCSKRQIPFLCDAAQWLGKLPGDALASCDFVSGCAHKFGGPKGAAFLKCPSQGRFHPLLVGGPQEDRRRAGTENVAAVLSMVAALEACKELRRSNQVAMSWREEFEHELVESLPGSVIVGQPTERLWNTVSGLMPVSDCQQRWVVKLDRQGVAVSTGSACASGKEAPSHVLTAMGYEPAEAGRVLRFSSGWNTSREDWAVLLDALQAVQRAFVR